MYWYVNFAFTHQQFFSASFEFEILFNIIFKFQVHQKVFFGISVLERVKGIWDQEEETGYIVAKVFNINITDGDIRSLRDKNWLTDQVKYSYK